MVSYNDLQALLSQRSHIIVAPISYKVDTESRIDFEREMEAYRKGDNVMWDDSSMNDGQIGDLFAFVMGQSRSEIDLSDEGTPGGYCQIRPVVATFSHDHRPKGIWKIPEHTDRRVLVLGDILFEGSWVGLCEALKRTGWGKTVKGVRYASPLRGTTRWEIVS